MGGPGPRQKCTVTVKVPPQAQGMLSGEERRHIQPAGSKRRWAEGTAGGRGLPPETQVQVGGLWDAGAESSPPSPSCLLPQPKYQLAEEEESGGTEGGRRGHKGRDPGRDGSYANGRTD